MSGADLERLRRQKVLKDLNSRLAPGTKAGLSITGHKIPIQGRLLYMYMSEYIYNFLGPFISLMCRHWCEVRS